MTSKWIEKDLENQKSLNVLKKNNDSSSFICWLFQEKGQYYITDLDTKLAANIKKNHKHLKSIQLNNKNVCFKICLKNFLYSSMLNFVTNESFLFVLINDFDLLGQEAMNFKKSDLMLLKTHTVANEQFSKILRSKPRVSLININQTKSKTQIEKNDFHTPQCDKILNTIRTRSQSSNKSNNNKCDQDSSNLSALIGQMSPNGSFRDYTIQIIENKKSPSKLKPKVSNLNQAFVKSSQSLNSQEIDHSNHHLTTSNNIDELDEQISSSKIKHSSQMMSMSMAPPHQQCYLENSTIHSNSLLVNDHLQEKCKKSSIEITRLGGGKDNSLFISQHCNLSSTENRYQSTQNNEPKQLNCDSNNSALFISPIKTLPNQNVVEIIDTQQQTSLMINNNNNNNNNEKIIKETTMIIDETKIATQKKQAISAIAILNNNLDSLVELDSLRIESPQKRNALRRESANSDSHSSTNLQSTSKRKRKLLHFDKISEHFQNAEKERTSQLLSQSIKSRIQNENLDADNEEDEEEDDDDDDDDDVDDDIISSDDSNNNDDDIIKRPSEKLMSTRPISILFNANNPKFNSSSSSSSSSTSSLSFATNNLSPRKYLLEHSKSLIFAPKSTHLNKERIYLKKSFSDKKHLTSKVKNIHHIFSPNRSKKPSVKNLFRSSCSTSRTVATTTATPPTTTLENNEHHHTENNTDDKRFRLTRLNSRVLDGLIKLNENDEDDIDDSSSCSPSKKLKQSANLDQSSISSSQRRKKLFNPLVYNAEQSFDCDIVSHQPPLSEAAAMGDDFSKAFYKPLKPIALPTSLTVQALLSPSLNKKKPTRVDLNLNQYYNTLVSKVKTDKQSLSSNNNNNNDSENQITTTTSTTKTSANDASLLSLTNNDKTNLDNLNNNQTRSSNDKSIPPGQNPNPNANNNNSTATTNNNISNDQVNLDPNDSNRFQSSNNSLIVNIENIF